MKELVTVTQNGDAIRISKVTAHGEEVIDADLEARALGCLLWKKISTYQLSGAVPLLPFKEIEKGMERLTQAVETLTAEIRNHAHSVEVLRSEFEQKKSTPVTQPRGQ